MLRFSNLVSSSSTIYVCIVYISAQLSLILTVTELLNMYLDFFEVSEISSY